MGEDVKAVLRGMLTRHGTALLDDHRRFEAFIRDTTLSRRDVTGVVAALKAGIPAQFLQLRTSQTDLEFFTFETYATRLVDETGLDAEFARGLLEAWAFALDVKVRSPSPRVDAPDPGTNSLGASAPDEVSKVDQVAPPTRADSTPPLTMGGRLLALLFAVQGLLLIYGSAAMKLQNSAGIELLLGALFIAVAAMVWRQAAWIRWPAVALCAVALLFTFSKLFLGIAGPVVFMAELLAVPGLIGLLLWRGREIPLQPQPDRAG